MILTNVLAQNSDGWVHAMAIRVISVPEIKDSMGHEVLGVHIADRCLYPF